LRNENADPQRSEGRRAGSAPGSYHRPFPRLATGCACAHPAAHKAQSAQGGFVAPELLGWIVLAAVAGLMLAGGV